MGFVSPAGRACFLLVAGVVCHTLLGSAAAVGEEIDLVSGWRFQGGADVKVASPDGRTGDKFGASVCMCGSYAYIGAPHDKMNGLSTGSVYAYKMAPDGSWKLSEKLFPGDTDNPADGDLFGASVSCDRNMTAVGAPSDGSLYAAGGAVYVYQRGLQAVLLVAKLTSYSGEANEQFGYSVAVSNNLVLVGAVGSSEAGASSGAVYAFRKEPEPDDDLLDDRSYGYGAGDDRVPDGWTLEAIIYPADVNAYDFFGASIGVSGSLIVIGAPNADGRRGAAYVYNRTLVYHEVTDDDLYNDDYARPPSYLLLKRLTGGEGTTAREFFGTSVAIDAHTIVVGQPMAFDDTYETQRGAAHVFTTHTSGKALDYWAHVAILTEPLLDAVTNKFGSSVAVRQNSVLVGAPGNEVYSDPTVYAFGRYQAHSASSNLGSKPSSNFVVGLADYSFWSNQAVLIPHDRGSMETQGVESDHFGSAVAISERGVGLVGAPLTLGGRYEASGGIYAYRAENVLGGSADTDDDPPPLFDAEEGADTGGHRVSKGLLWLVVLVVPACVLAVCMYRQRKRRRRRAGPSTSGGRQFGEGAGVYEEADDNSTDISDLGSDMSFHHLRGRVHSKISMLSTHAKEWIGGAVQNPVCILFYYCFKYGNNCY